MKRIQKSGLILLLLVAPTLSTAQAGAGFPSKRNNNALPPRCGKFYGYSLAARLGYEFRHPRMPDPLRKHREITVCLRENCREKVAAELEHHGCPV